MTEYFLKEDDAGRVALWEGHSDGIGPMRSHTHYLLWKHKGKHEDIRKVAALLEEYAGDVLPSWKLHYWWTDWKSGEDDIHETVYLDWIDVESWTTPIPTFPGVSFLSDYSKETIAEMAYLLRLIAKDIEKDWVSIPV